MWTLLITVIFPISLVLILAFIFDIKEIINHPIITSLLILSIPSLLFLKRLNDEHSTSLDFAENYVFPEKLHHLLQKRYPHLDAQQIQEIIEELRNFLIRKIEYTEQTAIISRAVETAWESFSQINNHYTYFCEHAFQHYLPYMPSSFTFIEALLHESIQPIWIHACQQEKIDPLFPDQLPPLFSLDERLAIPNANSYSIDQNWYAPVYPIAGAPSPLGIIEEIERKLLSTATAKNSPNLKYFTQKIRFYINNDEWVHNAFCSEINLLFRAISKHDELIIQLFGSNANLAAEKWRCASLATSDTLNPDHPDYGKGTM